MSNENALLFWRLMQYAVAPIVAAIIIFVSHVKIEGIKSVQAQAKDSTLYKLVADTIAKTMNENEKSDIKITNNTGNIVIGGSHNTQVIKQVNAPKRVIKQPVNIEERTYDNGSGYLIRITMNQTEGTWPDGEYFHLQLQLSGAYQQYKFVTGYNNMAFSDWTVSNEEGMKIGWFEWKTITPPKKEPIVLEISSLSKIKIVKLAISPSEEKPKS